MTKLDKPQCNRAMVAAFALQRANFLQKWEDLTITITEHISKVLLIVDDKAQKVWLKELDSKAQYLSKFKTKGRMSNDTYLYDIYDMLCFEDQIGLGGVISNPIRDYIDSPRNKTKSVLVREYEPIEFETDMNAFLYEFVEIVKFHKEVQKGNYTKGAIQKNPTIQEIITKYCNREYQHIDRNTLLEYALIF